MKGGDALAKRHLQHIKRASDAVHEDIMSMARHGGKYGAGLSTEGYHGGYFDALQDVLLVLRDVPPCRRPNYWRKNTTGPKTA